MAFRYTDISSSHCCRFVPQPVLRATAHASVPDVSAFAPQSNIPYISVPQPMLRAQAHVSALGVCPLLL